MTFFFESFQPYIEMGLNVRNRLNSLSKSKLPAGGISFDSLSRPNSPLLLCLHVNFTNLFSLLSRLIPTHPFGLSFCTAFFAKHSRTSHMRVSSLWAELPPAYMSTCFVPKVNPMLYRDGFFLLTQQLYGAVFIEGHSPLTGKNIKILLFCFFITE